MKKGFAAMSPERLKEVSSKGGRSAQAKGTAHRIRSSEEAAACARKGHGSAYYVVCITPNGARFVWRGKNRSWAHAPWKKTLLESIESTNSLFDGSCDAYKSKAAAKAALRRAQQATEAALKGERRDRNEYLIVEKLRRCL